ncbi:isochorismate synthase [Streptomyces olivaceiscleroticus]|uniref:isochorismate synthase n=1 Tax=Streptomyces olivaceiscleroticus TaxID=68245 RepID=A0ABN1B8K0_9ACTN
MTASRFLAPPTAPSFAAHRPTALLHAYRPRADRFFASPTRTLLARGVRHAVPHGSQPLSERVRATLDRARSPATPVPVVVGAIPFDLAAPCALVVPRALHWAPALASDPLIGQSGRSPVQGRYRLRPHPAPHEYAARVSAAVGRLRSGELDKVVLSRVLDVVGVQEIRLPGVLRRLAGRDPAGYLFAVPSGRDRTLVGASPELLVARRGRHLTTTLLAGSRPRGRTPAEDARHSKALRSSDKDRHEHAILVDAVLAALAPQCAQLHAPSTPTLLHTATMWHLATPLTGILATDGTTALDLACRLHPTPAVCGTPVHAARQLLQELEPFDRGMYAGLVGWQDAYGDGEWALTIRCAEVAQHTARLFAGAGIVADSCAQEETAETEAKFATLLHALGAGLPAAAGAV